jgi:type IV secretion system protein VirD4
VWELSSGKGARHRSVSVTEQKRPLMLAQEVRSLGRGKEIVFTEDTPPILCRKIRYYRVGALRDRVRKPPPVPAIELRREVFALRHASAEVTPRPDAPIGEKPGAGERPESEDPRVHEATLEDVDRADELTLEDYEVDFSHVPFPDHDGRMTDPEMTTAVEVFVHSVK